MRNSWRVRAVLAALCCAGAAARGLAASPDIVIAGAYVVAGGNAAAPVGDFVELFNRGCAPVSLGGWSLQTLLPGESGVWLRADLPEVSVLPGQYFLFRLNYNGMGGLNTYVEDFDASAARLDPQSSSGKIALVRTQKSLAGDCPSFSLNDVIDFFAWGAANCSEGAPRTPIATNSSGQGYRRSMAGCVDTDNNLANFYIPAGLAVPRSTLTPLAPCMPPTSPASTACALPDGTCQVLASTACTAAGGVSAAACSPCGPSGACCLPGGMCQQTTQPGCTQIGGLGWNAGGPCAVGVTGIERHYAAVGLPAWIPDGSSAGLSVSILVPDVFMVGDVNVRVASLDHTLISDLIIRITHGSQSQELWVHACDVGVNAGLDVTFDDEAPLVVVCASPTIGLLRPTVTGVGPLSVFDGASAQGSWQLQVLDTEPLEDGNLSVFEITLREGASQCVGACCLISGACSFVSTTECAGAGGVFLGLNTSCGPNPCPQPAQGACCFTTGPCVMLDPTACAGAGGLYQGDASLCLPDPCPSAAEACCLGDGACVELAPPDCGLSGGSPQGGGTSCAIVSCAPLPQACCRRDGACQELAPAACVTGGGFPAGPGSNCTPNVCAAACLRGDANCDGVINNFDIDFFVHGLLNNLAGYQLIGGTPQCFALADCWGDVNVMDGLNNFDIDPFVCCVLTPPPPLTHCPPLCP